jgi:hypothetical protein
MKLAACRVVTVCRPEPPLAVTAPGLSRHHDRTPAAGRAGCALTVECPNRSIVSIKFPTRAVWVPAKCRRSCTRTPSRPTVFNAAVKRARKVLSSKWHPPRGAGNNSASGPCSTCSPRCASMSARICGGTTTTRGLPLVGESIRQPWRWVTPRATVITARSSLMSLRRSSVTSPQRRPHQAAIRISAWAARARWQRLKPRSGADKNPYCYAAQATIRLPPPSRRGRPTWPGHRAARWSLRVAHHRRSRHSSRWGRSAPSVVSSPCPG